MALPLPMFVPEPEANRRAVQRIRRCTFRRVIDLEAGRDARYDVQCLYPDRSLPIPLGNMHSAIPICNACTAQGVFRPDEE